MDRTPNIVPLLSPAQAAKLLGKDRDFIMALFHAGEIQMFDQRRPGAKLPRWGIDPLELEKWRNSRLRVVVQPEQLDGSTAVGAPATSFGVVDAMLARRHQRRATSDEGMGILDQMRAEKAARRSTSGFPARQRARRGPEHECAQRPGQALFQKKRV